MQATLYTDGGARGNPGPAGIGYVLTLAGGEKIKHGEVIGKTTNNQAEYRALLAGMARAHAEQVTDLACFLDSELVVKQVNGIYRVKDHDLRIRVAEVASITSHFDIVTFAHIPRAKNAEADSLVNAALDKII